MFAANSADLSANDMPSQVIRSEKPAASPITINLSPYVFDKTSFGTKAPFNLWEDKLILEGFLEVKRCLEIKLSNFSFKFGVDSESSKPAVTRFFLGKIHE